MPLHISSVPKGQLRSVIGMLVEARISYTEQVMVI